MRVAVLERQATRLDQAPHDLFGGRVEALQRGQHPGPKLRVVGDMGEVEK